MNTQATPGVAEHERRSSHRRRPTDFDARREYGKEARRRTPRSAHEGWTPRQTGRIRSR